MRPFDAFHVAADALGLTVRWGDDEQTAFAYGLDGKIHGAFAKPWTSGMKDAFWLGGACYPSEEDALAVLINGAHWPPANTT